MSIPTMIFTSGSEGYYRPFDTVVNPVNVLGLSANVTDEISVEANIEEDLTVTMEVD